MRALWTGTITFGLVTIPIKLYSGSESHHLDLDLLRKGDLCPIKYSRVCRVDGKEVPWEEITKGYAYQDGDYILLAKEDFAKASPQNSHTIEINHFVKESEIDPVFYSTPYFMEPKKEGQKAYALLLKALAETKLVGVGEFVMRNHENLAVIKPYGDVLLLHKLRYNDEIRATDTLKLPTADLIKPNELKMATQLVNQLTEAFVPDDYKDTYFDELKKIIAAKATGKKLKKPKKITETGNVTDIMDLLKKSLVKTTKRKKIK